MTWKFNNTLSMPSGISSFELLDMAYTFTIKGRSETYNYFKATNQAYVTLGYTRMDVKIGIDNVAWDYYPYATNNTGAATTWWRNEDDKYITFSAEPTDENMIKFLEKNAVRQ